MKTCFEQTLLLVYLVIWHRVGTLLRSELVPGKQHPVSSGLPSGGDNYDDKEEYYASNDYTGIK
jgi:hypothetical protein